MVKYSTNTTIYVEQLTEWLSTYESKPSLDTLNEIESIINELVLDLNTQYDNGTDYFDNSKIQEFMDKLSLTSSKVIKTVTKSIGRSIIKDDLYELDIFM